MSVNTMGNGRPDPKRSARPRSLRQDRRGAALSMRSTPDSSGDTVRHSGKGLLRDRRGTVGAWVALMLVMLLGVTALTIDMGFLWVLRNRLQSTADASALAGASQLTKTPDSALVKTEAVAYAQKNMPPGGHGTVLADADVVLGHWHGKDHHAPGDPDLRTFIPKGTTGPPEPPGQACSNPVPQIKNKNCLSTNAVEVTTRRAEANGNPAQLFLAGILGIREADVVTKAIAEWGTYQARTRFLIDDEMIDSDVPVIENLAASLGVTPLELISDMDGDWFIDLPPGEVLELPTGQVGDEGLWDINYPEYPFGESSNPSHTDFLNYNEDSNSWRYDLVPKAMLDPLIGVGAVNDASIYPSYVDPNYLHVSPVYKSDVSELNPVNGAPAVNALGQRRGLLAFRVIGVGVDPDGPGSYLPNLIIEVVDPQYVTLDEVKPSTVGRKLRLVN